MHIADWEDRVEPVSSSAEDADADTNHFTTHFQNGTGNGNAFSPSQDKYVEALVAGFRESDFLKFIIRQSAKTAKDANLAATKELIRAKVRSESKGTSETAQTPPPGVPLHEKLEPSGMWLRSNPQKQKDNSPRDSQASSEETPVPATTDVKPVMKKTLTNNFPNRFTWWNSNRGTKQMLGDDTDDRQGAGRVSHFGDFAAEFERRMTQLKRREGSQKMEPGLSLFSEHGHVFADVDAMKEQVRKAIENSAFKVSDYYHETGICQAIARTHIFECVTLLVIAVNALWIAVEMDANAGKDPADVDAIWQVADHFFCTYFVMEWLIRFGAYKNKRDGLKDSWFIIDTLLMIIMVIDTWFMLIILNAASTDMQASIRSSDTSVIKILRMSRMMRMARMAHLVGAVPELTILVKGMFVAARSVFFTLFLLAIFIYIFAVAFRQLTDGLPIGERYFPSVPTAMRTLLLEGTLPDIAVFVDKVSEQHILLGMMTLLYILLGSLTVMNMLVGVLVEVVSVVSAVEKEELKVNYVKNRLLKMLDESGLDENNDMIISRKEFEELLVSPEAAKAIQDVGVDPVGLVDFAEFIFQDTKEEEGLSFPDFINVVLQFRGSNNCTVRDAVDLRKVILKEFHLIQTELKSQTQQLWFVIDSLAQQLLGRTSQTSVVTSRSTLRAPTSSARQESLRNLSRAAEEDASRVEATSPPSIRIPDLPTGSPPPMSKLVKWA